MSKLLGVRLDKSDQEKLTFLYKLYQVESEKESIRFRNLLNAIYSEKMNPSNTPALSTTQHQELELLRDWDCKYRAVVYRFGKHTKKSEPFVHCSAMNTRKILGTNIIDIPVCKKCHDRGASSVFVSIPAPKKEEKPTPTQKPQRVQKQRKCATCGTDISSLEDWKTLCYSCWNKKQNPAWQSETEPLRGSPVDLRKREADAIRRAHEQIKEE